MPNYILPNWGAQTDSSAYKNSLDAAAAKHDKIAGQFYAHEADTPDMTVVIDAGRLLYAGGLVIQPQQITTAITAPVTNPRIDRVVISQSTGAYLIVAGVEAVSPVAPSIPSGYLPCVQFELAAAAVSITNSVMVDERLLIPEEKQFRGCVATRSTTTTVPANTWTAVLFTAEMYDTDSIHDLVINTGRVTVPAGVTKVRVTASATWNSSSVGNRVMSILKGGSTAYDGFAGNTQSINNVNPAQTTYANAVTPVITVSGGDYFELYVYSNVATTLSTRPTLSMEIVE